MGGLLQAEIQQVGCSATLSPRLVGIHEQQVEGSSPFVGSNISQQIHRLSLNLSREHFLNGGLAVPLFGYSR